MSLQTESGGLEIEVVGRVTVLKFRDRQILRDEAVQALGRQLRSLAAGSGPRQLLLDFGKVERLSSAVLGQIVTLERAVRQAGGRLVLCGVRPDLADVLIITRLDKYLDLYPSEEEALQRLL